MAHHEEELARELQRRGLTRREVLKIAAGLGLSATGVSTLLAACSAPASSSTQGSAAPAAGSSGSTAPDPSVGQSIYSAGDGSEGPWPATVYGEPTSKVTLSVAHAWDAAFFERQKQFDQLFTKRHPNIEIKAENTPFAEYLQKYTAQAAGNALPDIMYVQFAWAQQLIKQGLLVPLDEHVAKQTDFNINDFSKPSLVSYRRDGKLYGVPYDEGPGNLYYNKDLFDKAGVKYPDDSWTLDDLKANALKLTSGSGPNKIFGLGELPSPGDGLMAPNALIPFGAKYLSEPDETQSFINSDASVKAMEWWQELRTKGAVPSPQDLQNVAWPPFQFGKIAMTLQGSWATPPILQNSKFKWDIAKWPKGPQAHTTFSAGSCYTITRDSKIAQAAWTYMNEYLSAAGQVYMWASTGRGSPSRLSAWPAYLKSKFVPAGAKNVQEALTSTANKDIIEQVAGPKVTQAAQPIWDLVVAGQLSVKDALNQIQAAIEPLLAENKA